MVVDRVVTDAGSTLPSVTAFSATRNPQPATLDLVRAARHHD